METVLTRLPRYARGLKLIRLGVFVMLGQLVLSAIVSVKTFGADTPDEVLGAFRWMQYLFWANIGASLAMMVACLLALPDFRLARLPTGRVIVAAIGFAVTTAALWWSYDVLGTFMDVALDPDTSLERLVAAGDDLSSLGFVAIVKDVAYVGGLIAVLRMVRQSAVANDQLGLRDAASSLTGLLVLMLIGDLFYQLTYGLAGGGTIPLIGFLAAVLIAGYWIYCHLRLARFFENAAYFVNEPHHIPTATVVSGATTVGEPPRPSARTLPRPQTSPSAASAIPRTTPSDASAPVIVVAPEVRTAEAPRAESDSAEPPRFLT